MRILLVEDDARLSDVVRRSLTDRGHVVDVESDGRNAIEVAQSGTYDAIILDVMLPGADGFSVLRTIRASGCKTPVLMLTARDSTHDVLAGLDGGADDYLRKPFVFVELEARLRSITRRELRAAPVESLVVGDIVMDLGSRRVRRGEREISLTARETAFLEYFMRHPNKLIPRQLLEEALWESDRDSASNLIEVYVSRLRRKLSANREPDAFSTVRGVGYRFGEPASND
jgi:two-component system OmpR family response regulator